MSFCRRTSLSDVNTAWHSFKTEYLKICQIFAPIRKILVKDRYSPWFYNEILLAIYMYNRDKLHRQAKLTGSPQTWNKYKTARNKVTSLIRKSKKAHYANQLNNSKSKTKDIWRTLKELLPNKMSVNSPAIKDPQVFNNYFSSVANELTKDYGPVTLPLFNTDHVTTKFDFLTIK